MRMVPEVGLEPTLAEANTALNRARLPIPPLRQRTKRPYYKRPLRGASGRAPALARGRPCPRRGTGPRDERDSANTIRLRHLAPVALAARSLLFLEAERDPLPGEHAMRSSTLVAAAGLVAASACRPPSRAADEDGYRHGRVRFVESGVTLHRATEVSAEEALANLPFLPGDRVWSDASGRVEFQFPDGTLVRLDSRSKLDYSGHEEGQDERIVLRLWSGSLIARVRTSEAARFEIETPAGSVELLDQAMVRVDVEAGETRVSAYRGEAVLDDGRGRVRLSSGERTRGALGRSRRGARGLRHLARGRLRALGRGARVGGALGLALVGVPPGRARPLRGRAGAQRQLALRGVGRIRLDAPRRRRLEPLLERALELDALRLDLGSLRDLGLGPVPLRALGLLGVRRLVLGARPHLGAGLGELGRRQRLRRLVPARLSRPARPCLGRAGAARATTAATPCRGTAGTAAGTWSARATSGTATSRGAACRSPASTRARSASRTPRTCGPLGTRVRSPWRTPRRGRSAGGPRPGTSSASWRVDNKTTIPSPWLSRGRARAEESRARQSASRAGETTSGRSSRPRETQAYRDTQAYRRGESSRSASRPEATARNRAERSDRLRARARAAVSPASAGARTPSGVRAPRARRATARPRHGVTTAARRPGETSRSEPRRSEPRTPRAESGSSSRAESSSSSSRSDSGARSGGSSRSGDSSQRSSGGRGSDGGGQRSAPRPPRNRN